MGYVRQHYGYATTGKPTQTAGGKTGKGSSSANERGKEPAMPKPERKKG